MDRFTYWVYSVINPQPIHKKATGPDDLSLWLSSMYAMRKTAADEIKPDEQPVVVQQTAQPVVVQQTAQPSATAVVPTEQVQIGPTKANAAKLQAKSVPVQQSAMPAKDAYLETAKGLYNGYSKFFIPRREKGWSDRQVILDARDQMYAKARKEYLAAARGLRVNPDKNSLDHFMNRQTNEEWGLAMNALNRELDNFNITQDQYTKNIQRDWYLLEGLATGNINIGASPAAIRRAAQAKVLNYENYTKAMPLYMRLNPAMWFSDPYDSLFSTTRVPRADLMRQLENDLSKYDNKIGGSLLTGRNVIDNRANPEAWLSNIDLSGLSEDEQVDLLTKASLLADLRMHGKWGEHVGNIEAAPWKAFGEGFIGFGSGSKRDISDRANPYFSVEDYARNRALVGVEHLLGNGAANVGVMLLGGSPIAAATNFGANAINDVSDAVGWENRPWLMDATTGAIAGATNPIIRAAGIGIGKIPGVANFFASPVTKTVSKTMLYGSTAAEGAYGAVAPVVDAAATGKIDAMSGEISRAINPNNSALGENPRDKASSPEELAYISAQHQEATSQSFKEDWACRVYAAKHGVSPETLTPDQKQAAIAEMTPEDEFNALVAQQRMMARQGYAVDINYMVDPRVSMEDKCGLLKSVLTHKLGGELLAHTGGDSTRAQGIIAQIFGEGLQADLYGKWRGDNSLNDPASHKPFVLGLIRDLALDNDPEVRTMLGAMSFSIGEELKKGVMTPEQLEAFKGSFGLSAVDGNKLNLSVIDILKVTPGEQMYDMLSTVAGNDNTGEQLMSLTMNLKALNAASGTGSGNIWKDCPVFTDNVCSVITDTIAANSFETGRFAGLLKNMHEEGAFPDDRLKQAVIDGIGMLDGEEFGKGVVDTANITWDDIWAWFEAKISGKGGNITDNEMFSKMSEQDKEEFNSVVVTKATEIAIAEGKADPAKWNKLIAMALGMKGCPQLAAFCADPIKFWGTLLGIVGIGGIAAASLFSGDDDDEDEEEEIDTVGVDERRVREALENRYY